MVHDVGGWAAAVEAAHAGTLPTDGNPYAGKSGGALWDIGVYGVPTSTAQKTTLRRQRALGCGKKLPLRLTGSADNPGLSVVHGA